MKLNPRYPGEWDVCCSRGFLRNKNPANLRWGSACHKHWVEWAADLLRERECAASVYCRILSTNRGKGRFTLHNKYLSILLLISSFVQNWLWYKQCIMAKKSYGGDKCRPPHKTAGVTVRRKPFIDAIVIVSPKVGFCLWHFHNWSIHGYHHIYLCYNSNFEFSPCNVDTGM